MSATTTDCVRCRREIPHECSDDPAGRCDGHLCPGCYEQLQRHEREADERERLKPWLIGESNPYGPLHGHDERFALYESAGGRLCRLVLGLEPHVYRALYVRRNLLAQPKWSAPAARESARRVLEESGGATLVLLGSKVAAAFGFPFVPFTSARERARTFVCLPHPSGLSRAWNEAGAFERAREVMRAAGALP